MVENVNEIIRKLSRARRKKIEARAAALIAEEMTLEELRRARKQTQARMARTLGIAQKQISNIEKRTDMHISTLRRAVEALGGSLSLIAQFPDREPVTLSGIATPESAPPPARVVLRRGVEVGRITRPQRKRIRLPDLSSLRASTKVGGRPLSEDIIEARRSSRY